MNSSRSFINVLKNKVSFFIISASVFCTIFLCSCQSPVAGDYARYEIMHSTDNGQSWSYSEAPDLLFQFGTMDEGNTLTALSTRTMFRSYDNAHNFVMVKQWEDASYLFIPTGEFNCGIFINKFRSLVFHSRDQGITLDSIKFPKDFLFNGGIDIDTGSGLGILVGEYNLYKTIDHGLTWDVLETNINDYRGYGKVDIVNSNIIYLQVYGTDYHSTSLLKSTDAGVTWRKFLITETNHYVNITFSDENTGVVSGPSSDASVSTISRTTDGGETWNLCGPVMIAPIAIQFCGNSLMATTKHFTYRSTNSGSSWDTLNVNNKDFFSGIYSPSPDHIVISALGHHVRLFGEN